MLKGRRLSGRYKVLNIIGGGGMANVYLAQDVILERNVAIKVLRLDFANDEEFIKRFRREAHSATSLAHPNIVSIYDVGEEDDIYYIVMEYVEGQTLKQYIQKNAPLSPRETLDIMEQLASAISHAHHNQIVHRDIKPQNILIDNNGTVKITDFGIAVASSSTTITQTNSVLGSVHYLSPEQARGGLATRKSDIYSLGIVMFELLTGRVPFEGESAVSIALKHLQSETPSPKRWNPSIPQSVENIILKATAKDPFHRYDSVFEMEEDLRTALFPERIDEEKWTIPVDDDEITKAIPIIKDEKGHFIPDETIIKQSKNDKNNGEQPKPKKEKNKKKKNRLLISLSIIFFLILAAGISAFTIFPALFLPDDIEVPDVTELEYDEAVRILEEKGFEIDKTIEQINDEIPEGHVIRTDPKAGFETKKGSSINIYKSTGKKKVEFDNYIGRNFDDVKEKLNKEGYLAVYPEYIFSDSVPGTIISQSIEEKELVIPEETEITFQVSKGVEKIKLKDLNGYNEKAILDYAEELGINVVLEHQYHDTIAEGQVISQSPKAHSEITKDDEVKVIISKGKEPKEPKIVKHSITIPYTQNADGIPQTVQIKIEDAKHSIIDVYDEFPITETTKITIELEINPDEEAKYMVIIDGSIHEQQVIPYPTE